MVQYSHRSLDTAFAALGDPTRRAVLLQLARGECSITELAAPHKVSLTAIQKHFRVLERAGLIAHEKRGRVRHVRLARTRRSRGGMAGVSEPPLREMKDWIAHFESFWDDSLERLKLQVETDL